MWSLKQLAVMALYSSAPNVELQFFIHCTPFNDRANEILQTAIKGEHDPNLIKNAKVLIDVWQTFQGPFTFRKNNQVFLDYRLAQQLEQARDHYKPFYIEPQQPVISLEERAAVLAQIDDDCALPILISLLEWVDIEEFKQMAMDCKGARLFNAYTFLLARKECIQSNVPLLDGQTLNMDFYRILTRISKEAKEKVLAKKQAQQANQQAKLQAKQQAKRPKQPAKQPAKQIKRDSSPKR